MALVAAYQVGRKAGTNLCGRTSISIPNRRIARSLSRTMAEGAKIQIPNAWKSSLSSIHMFVDLANSLFELVALV
jgi:hypothetical protein